MYWRSRDRYDSVVILRAALVTALAMSALWVGTAHAAPPPAPSPELARSWQDRLPSTAVASYLREGDKRVLVVPAGEPTTDLAAVGTATMIALRDSGRFDLIMDPSALGQLGQLSDQEIVGKATGSPVTAVLVVRVFGEGAQASVVATAYALDGSVISAFSVSPGASLAVRPDQTDGSGVSESTVGAISEVMQDNSGEGAEHTPNKTELEYLERFLHYRYMVQFNVYTGQGTAFRTGQVLRGLDNVPLSDYEMLEYIGEPDLARRHRSRQRLKAGLMASGGVLGFGPLVAGAILFGIAHNENCFDDLAFFSCEQSAKIQPAGVGLMVVGSIFTTGFIAGAALPTLVNTKKKNQLLNDYNKSLRRELLLPDDIEDRLLSSTERRDRRQRRARMLATWQLAPSGAGLSFSGRF
jgi:hypothetical protein